MAGTEKLEFDALPTRLFLDVIEDASKQVLAVLRAQCHIHSLFPIVIVISTYIMDGCRVFVPVAQLDRASDS